MGSSCTFLSLWSLHDPQNIGLRYKKTSCTNAPVSKPVSYQHSCHLTDKSVPSPSPRGDAQRSPDPDKSSWVSCAGSFSCPGASEELPTHLGPAEESKFCFPMPHGTLGSQVTSKAQGHLAFYKNWYLQGRTGDIPSSDLAPSHSTAGSGSCGTESLSPPKRG